MFSMEAKNDPNSVITKTKQKNTKYDKHDKPTMYTNAHNLLNKSRFSLFYWQKSGTFPGLSKTPWKICQDLFVAKECINITYWHHMLKSRGLQVMFFIWAYEKMHDFEGYFSRTFQVLEFSRKKNPVLSRTFQKAWEPCQSQCETLMQSVIQRLVYRLLKTMVKRCKHKKLFSAFQQNKALLSIPRQPWQCFQQTSSPSCTDTASSMQT